MGKGNSQTITNSYIQLYTEKTVYKYQSAKADVFPVLSFALCLGAYCVTLSAFLASHEIIMP